MAQITVVYKDFEEMKAVARVILGLDPNASVADQAAATVEGNVISREKETGTDAAQLQATPAMPPVQQVPIQQPVPTTTPTYTLDDLARAGMTLMDVGRQADLQQLLARFGVQALPALPSEQYGAFATALRELGAQI